MEHIIITSLFVFAIWYTMQEGEIFGAAQKIKLNFLADPMRDCPVCMVPYYGSLLYWIAWHQNWADWIMTIIPALGLNAVLVKLFPDKETPGLHQELGDIHESIVDIGQILKDSIHKNDPVRKRAGR